jgi:hypothetical protein
MATKPKPWALNIEKPEPPTLPREGAVNEKDRLDRKVMWDKYDFYLKSWNDGQTGAATAKKAQEQKKAQEKKVEDSYAPMKERLRKQQEAEKAKQAPPPKAPAEEDEAEKPVDQSGLGGLGKKRNPWA